MNITSDSHSDENDSIGSCPRSDQLKMAADAKIENAKARLEACRSDYLQLQFQMSYLTDQSDRRSCANSLLQQLKEEIMMLEKKISGSETQHSSTQDITEMESLEDSAPPGKLAEFNDTSEIAPDQDQIDQFDYALRILDEVETRHSKAAANRNQFYSQQDRTSIMGSTITTRLPSVIHQQVVIDTEDDISSVGASTITTLPPSIVEFNPQHDALGQQDDALTQQDDAVADDIMRFTEVSAAVDPILETFDADATPILSATLVTQPVSKEQKSVEPVYDAVGVSDEPLSFWKKHKLIFPLVFIICILTGAIIGLVFGVQKSDSQPTMLLVADSLAPSTSISPSTYFPSVQLSSSNQPTPCRPYRVSSLGTAFNDDCKYECNPWVIIDGNNVLIAKPVDERVHFFDYNGGSPKKSSTFNLESYIYSIEISGNYAAVGIPEYNNYTGAVVVFEKNATAVWNQVVQIEPDNITSFAFFGFSVDIENETLAIGAPDDAEKGSVYFYSRINNTWTPQSKLVSGSDSGVFGESISMRGNVIAISDTLAGNNSQEAVFIYTFDSQPNTWIQTNKVSNDDCGMKFGSSVELTGDLGLLVMCAEDLNDYETGAVYYYSRSDDEQYELQQTITPSKSDGSLKSIVKNTYEIVSDGNNMLLGYYSGTNGKVQLFTKENDMWTEGNVVSPPPNQTYFADYFTLSGRNMLISSSTNVHTYSLDDC
jgi:hypothetical protein